MSQRDQQQGKFIPALLMAVGSAYALYRLDAPLVSQGEVNGAPAVAAFFLLVSGCAVLGEGFTAIGGLFDLMRAKTPTGVKGTSGWIKRRWQIWRDHKWFGWAPYWGTLGGKEIMADYESVALTIGPPGSGKSVGVVEPMALSIHGSKIIPDFKGSLGVVLGPALRERGEDVLNINVGNVFSNEYGASAKYNPLCLVVDNYWQPGGLRDVTDELAELALQFIPEKADVSGENKYFRDGSRDLIEFAMMVVTLVHGDSGTLGHVAQLLKNREDLLWHALWASGRLPVLEGDAA